MTWDDQTQIYHKMGLSTVNPTLDDWLSMVNLRFVVNKLVTFRKMIPGKLTYDYSFLS